MLTDELAKSITVFDVETPNSRNDRICSIGLTFIEDGEVTGSEYYLVNPECGFDEFNIGIHGIYPEDVKGAPTFPELWESIRDHFYGSLLAAHNAGFDVSVLKKCFAAYGMEESPMYYVCTVTMARSSRYAFSNCKLPTICNAFDIELDHHNAASDSDACAYILCRFLRDGMDLDEFMRSSDALGAGSKHHKSGGASSTTLALRHLQSFVSQISRDGILSNSEAYALSEWMRDNSRLRGNYPFDAVFTILNDAMADGVLDLAELEHMQGIFSRLSDPVTEFADDCSDEEVAGKTFCLTGEFSCGRKDEVERLIERCGGTVQKNLTRAADVLLVGGRGSPEWGQGNYGSKLKKALERKEKGEPIRIWREADFLRLVRQ